MRGQFEGALYSRARSNSSRAVYRLRYARSIRGRGIFGGRELFGNYGYPARSAGPNWGKLVQLVAAGVTGYFVEAAKYLRILFRSK